MTWRTNSGTSRFFFVHSFTARFKPLLQACPTEDRAPDRSMAENLYFGRTPHPEARGCSGTKHQHSAIFRASFSSATCPSRILPAIVLVLHRPGHDPDATGLTLLLFPGSRSVPLAAFDRTGGHVALDEYAQDSGGAERAMLEGPRLRPVRRRQAGRQCSVDTHSTSRRLARATGVSPCSESLTFLLSLTRPGSRLAC